MKLGDAIEGLWNLHEDAVLCAKRPWTQDAECKVVDLDDQMKVPQEIKAAGFEYLLGVHVARDVLGVFGDREPTTDEKIRLLIFYAENDAYPDWVYS